ncbi:MAG: thioredoxin family protein [Euryhalocaulis sp.]|uniref:protein-disulfide reductase DsbD family protein n=1 Tax=Euryhalocaulis sp. TaxID=2744307 RepID=UPI0017C20749|nr:thioredoxin family protein [Euryhalocaulis sp.]MBA4801166.1 thioredoxin family protein [Euryhalocaulis sp.]
MRALLTALCLIAAPLTGGAALAQDALDTGLVNADPATVETDNVKATLAADSIVVSPGQTFYIALHQDIREGWHTYWRNPGDSGEPTQIDLTLPDGWEAGEIVWPAPEPLPVGPLTNYGFSNEVLLPIPVTVPEDFDGAAAAIKADAYWLVCEEICIPESGKLELSLRVSEGEPRVHPRWGDRIADALAAMPQPALFDSTIALDGETAQLSLQDAGLSDALGAGDLRDFYFFPYEPGMVEAAADQTPHAMDDALILALTPGYELEDGAAPVAGVLTYEMRGAEGWAGRAVEISAEPGEAADLSLAAAPARGGDGAGGGGQALLLALIGAFVGGLILNLMPCVFPVLSLKALGFAQKAHEDPGTVRRHGLLFMGGVLVTFAALGLLLVALKAGGAAVGWGFQLQNPAVIMALALLFFLISMNLLGFFEIGGGLQNLGSGLVAGRSGGAAAFLTGVLAVIVATPCTAPFMAAALGYALSLPALGALAIFLALGLGLAAPFTLLAFFPALLRRLPRPGPWMDRFKQFMAFPMLAATVWLVWVLSIQAGPTGVAFALIGLLAAGFAIWAGRFSGWTGRAAALGAMIAALLTVPAAAQLSTGGASVAETSGAPGALSSEPWSRERVAQLQAEGRPIFVDFTAAWCITCQVNERTALKTSDVAAAFAQNDVAFLVADWTNKDAEIAAELERFGRAGVPLYLYYPPGGGAPEILPQILTERGILNTIRKGAAATS